MKTQVNRGLAWIGAASSMVWLLDFVGMVIVLRWFISPEEIGIAAVAIPLFPAIELIAELGLGAAVIQRDDHSRDRLSTIFWVGLGSSLLLALVLAFGLGPFLSWFHGASVVGAMITVYSVKIILQNAVTIPRALMRKELRFKEDSIIRTLSNVAEFAAKVGFAIAGWGVWCLVMGPICRGVVVAIGVQICNPWWPRFAFRFRDAKHWIKFGIKSSASQLFYEIYTNVDYQVMLRMFGPEANGLYYKAYELVIKPCFLIGQTLQPLALAAYSRLRLEREQLMTQFVSFSRLSLVVMLAFVALILVSAEELLVVIYSEKWVGAAGAARILCGVAVLRAVRYAVPPLLEGMGRPGLGLADNLTATIVLAPMFYFSALWFGDSLGYHAVAWAWVVGYPIPFMLLLILAFSLLELSPWQYLRRIYGIPASAVLAGAAGWAAKSLMADLPGVARLLVSVTVTALVLGLLLAYWQGISPRTLKKALKG